MHRLNARNQFGPTVGPILNDFSLRPKPLQVIITLDIARIASRFEMAKAKSKPAARPKPGRRPKPAAQAGPPAPRIELFIDDPTQRAEADRLAQADRHAEADRLAQVDPPAVIQPVEKKKPPSGWDKIRAAGRRAIMLAVTPEEYARFESAARADRRAISAWIVYAALQQLRVAIDEKGNPL